MTAPFQIPAELGTAYARLKVMYCSVEHISRRVLDIVLYLTLVRDTDKRVMHPHISLFAIPFLEFFVSVD